MGVQKYMAFNSWRRKRRSKQEADAQPTETLNSREPLWTKNFSLIWIMNFATFGWAIMLNATFPFYILHLGGNELLVGITAAGFSIAALTMRPVAGWVLDNKSRGGMLRVGLILLITITVLYLTIPILAVVIVIRIVSGLVFAGVTTSTQTNAADVIPKSRFGEGLGMLGISNTVATALAPVIGLTIIATWDFTVLFVVLITVILIAFFMERGIKYRSIKVNDAKFFRQSKLSTLFNKDALPAAVVMMFTAAPFGGITAFVALYGEVYGLGFGGIFFIFTAIGSAGIRIFLSRVLDTKGEKPMIILGNSCVFLALFMLVLNNTISYYFAGFLTGVGIGISIPAMKAMALRIVPPERRGSATATFLCAFDLSGGLGGLTAGVFVTALGYRPMFAVLGIFTIISFLIYIFWASKTASAFSKTNTPLSK
jgi:MFS family permease